MKNRLKMLVLLLTAAAAVILLHHEAQTQRSRSSARTEPPAEKMTSGGYPERYSPIVSKNLFRKLGWAPQKKEDSIHLRVTVVSASGNRAVINYNGKTHYVREGDSLGSGYNAVSIAEGYVLLEKESGEQRALKMDNKLVSAGASASSAKKSGSASNKARSSNNNEKRSRDFRWRPPKGASGTEIFEMIMKREGVNWDDVKRDPELGAKLKKEYSYVFEEMSDGDKK